MTKDLLQNAYNDMKNLYFKIYTRMILRDINDDVIYLFYLIITSIFH